MKEKLLEYISSLGEEMYALSKDEDFMFTFSEAKRESSDFEDFLDDNNIPYNKETEIDGGYLFEMYYVKSVTLKKCLDTE